MLGASAACAGIAHADSRVSASGFVGVAWPGEHTALGNSWAPEQVPGTAPLFGMRAAWLALPALPGDLQLAVEGELALAPAFTGSHDNDGTGARMAYFAPVFAWRAHALLRLVRWSLIAPHVVLGGGGETVLSSSPFMSKETDPLAYWGLGASVPVARGWALRFDGRHGIMPARVRGATSTFELALGVATTFGAPARPARATEASALPVAPVVAAPAPVPEPDRDSDGDGVPDARDRCPAEPETPNGITDDDGCPETDPDHDGIVGGADRCPDQAEDLDGFADDDGCPDRDNDGDGIPDASDVCPSAAETVNGFTDDDGCPDQVPDDIVATLATRVPFEPTRARITPAAGTALLPVLAMLQRMPALHLDVIGHPDRAAGADLARRRAEAVKWYLVDQGIAEDRIATRVGDVAKAPPVEFQLAVAARAP